MHIILGGHHNQNFKKLASFIKTKFYNLFFFFFSFPMNDSLAHQSGNNWLTKLPPLQQKRTFICSKLLVRIQINNIEITTICKLLQTKLGWDMKIGSL